jgi:hypothetical protein
VARWSSANNRRRRIAKRQPWWQRPLYLGTDANGNHLFIVEPRVERDIRKTLDRFADRMMPGLLMEHPLDG